MKSNYLSPYLESLEADFSNGANFAIAGSATLPKYVAFSLNIQILQFRRFHNHSLRLQSQGLNLQRYLQLISDYIYT